MRGGALLAHDILQESHAQLPEGLHGVATTLHDYALLVSSLNCRLTLANV